MSLKRCTTYFVDPYMMIMTASMMMQVMIVQQILLENSCLYRHNSTVCQAILNKNGSQFPVEEISVQREASKWNLIACGCFGLLSIMSSTFYGTVGTILAKKYVLLMISTGNLSACVLLIMISYLKVAHGVLVGVVMFQVLSGITGGISSVIMMSNSYLSDFVPVEKKTTRFSKFEISLFVALVFGPLICGYSLDYLGIRKTASIIIVPVIIAIIYALFLRIKRTDNEAKRLSYKSKMKEILPHIIIKRFVEIFKATDRIYEQRMLLRLAIVANFVYSIAFSGYTSLIYLYQRRSPLAFSNSQMGIYNAVFYIAQSIGIVVLLPLIRKMKHDIADAAIIVVSICGRIVTFMIYAFMQNKLTAYISIIFVSVCAFEAPVTRALLSKQIRDSQISKIFGLLATFQAAGYLCGQLIAQPIYRATVAWFPGLIFLLCVGLLLIEMILMIIVLRFELRLRNLQQTAETDKSYAELENIKEAEIEDNT